MAADNRTMRVAFLLQLKSGARDEYVEHHRTLPELWPELADELGRSGIGVISIFEVDPEHLVLVSEVSDEGAWDRFWSSEPHAGWSKIMEPLMHYGPDGRVASTPITEIWRFESRDSR